MGGIGECLVGRELTLAAGADHVLAPSPPALCLDFYSPNTHSFSEEGRNNMCQVLSYIPH